MRRVVALSACLAAAAALAADRPLLTGAAAFGDWRTDAPGVRRLITPADLPPPFATRSIANPSRRAPRTTAVAPNAPPGFAVDLFATGLAEPRVIRTAPNGDVFVAESGAGRVLVFRADGKTPAPVQGQVFAADLPHVFGIAFYPSGPDPHWVYVATVGSVWRIPYRSGDLKASGPAEMVVRKLPTGGAHWTRDIAFSPDDKTMFVSVGSATNDAEGVRSARRAGARRVLGRGARPRRRARLRSRRRNERVFATGLRNCSGLTVQPSTGALWCVVNERDGLGDDLPPDYATRVAEGAFYGWPWYYIGAHEDPRHKGERPDLAETRDHARRAHPGSFRAARDHVLRGGPVSRRIQGRRLRRAARLVEPGEAHGIQGRAAPDEGRKAHRRLRGFPHRLRRRRRKRLGPPGRRRDDEGRRPARHRRRRRGDLAGDLRGRP